MKNLKSFLGLFAAIAMFSIALVSGLDTPVVATVASVTGVVGSVHVAHIMGFITLPTGVLFEYIGAPGVSTDGAGIQVISTERERAIHLNNSLKAKYAGKQLVPGYMRLEATINNVSNTLKFVTYTGDSANVYPTEKRLDRNDSFLVSELAVYLLKQDVANKKTNGVPLTYPNITAFGAAAAADLMALYTSGKLNVEINKKREIPDLDLLRFLAIPETQQSGAGNYDSFDKKQGVYHCTPQFEIDGSGTNDINVTFETYAGFAGGTAVGAGMEHRLVLLFRGFYVQNGSSNV